jgi:hypothetical protein
VANHRPIVFCEVYFAYLKLGIAHIILLALVLLAGIKGPIRAK